MTDKDYLKLTLEEAKHGLNSNEGGPFGAVIVINNKIISQAHNTVIKDNDPSAHAEVNAIRTACKKLNNYHLPKNAILYSSSEPCPMCLATSYWARINKIVYITNRQEVDEASQFMDENLYKEICKNQADRKIEMIESHELKNEAIEILKSWTKKGKENY